MPAASQHDQSWIARPITDVSTRPGLSFGMPNIVLSPALQHEPGRQGKPAVMSWFLRRTNDTLADVVPPVLYCGSERSNLYAIRAYLQFATKSLQDTALKPLAIEAAGVATAWAARVGIPPREVDGPRPTAAILGAS